ncbi:hypothetical protein RIV07_29315, partial [Pseudomonas baetica]|nr:hypothetical protein [Pseudomonas baetica]
AGVSFWLAYMHLLLMLCPNTKFLTPPNGGTLISHHRSNGYAPKPQTPNPKPQTPNPKPQTPNPKPQTQKNKIKRSAMAACQPTDIYLAQH